MTSKKRILNSAIECLAESGYAGTSIRDVARKANVQSSVIYYYFPDKDALLYAAFREITAKLQTDMAPIRNTDNASAMLRAVINYQFQQRRILAALLNYFVARSDDFPKLDVGGYVPAQAYYHIFGCLQTGSKTGQYQSHTSLFDAKIVAHIMNGFILEYASRPLPQRECDQLVEAIASFIEAAAQTKEGASR